MKHLAMYILLVISVVALIIMGICFYLKCDKLKTALIELEELKTMCVTFEEIDKHKEADIFSYIKSYYKRVPSPIAHLIAENAVKFANETHIPVSVVIGIIEVESSFNPCQVSSAKARGLMQVRWCVWEKVLKGKNIKDEFDLHEIDNSILAGTTVLKHYINKNNGDLSKALYNYVGKDERYILKVYKSMGRFILHER